MEYVDKLSLLIEYVKHPCNSSYISLQCIWGKKCLCADQHFNFHFCNPHEFTDISSLWFFICQTALFRLDLKTKMITKTCMRFWIVDFMKGTPMFKRFIDLKTKKHGWCKLAFDCKSTGIWSNGAYQNCNC